jgi:hypothetical protein
MSLEQAIIQLVIEGGSTFDATNQKIQADLTSMERAGKSAESAASAADKAAKDAEKSARAMQAQIGRTLSRLSSAINLAERGARAAGFETEAGCAFDVAKDVIGGAAQGAQLGAIAGPKGAAVGLVVGGAIGLAEGLAKISQQNERMEKKVDQIQHGPGRNELESAVARESIRARLDQAASGGVRQIQ